MEKTANIIKLAKTSRKALQGVRLRLDQMSETIDANDSELRTQLGRIERTLGSNPVSSGAAFRVLAEALTGDTKSVASMVRSIEHRLENQDSRLLNELRDIKRALSPDSASIAGVLHKLDLLVPEMQGVNAGANKLRADILGAVRDLTGNVKYLRTDMGALHDRQADVYELVKVVHANVGSIRSTTSALEDVANAAQSPDTLRPALAEVRDGIKQLGNDVVEVAVEVSEDIKECMVRQGSETRDQIHILADAVRGLQGHGPEAGVLRGRLEHAIGMVVDIGKHVSSLEDQERHIGMTTRNKVDGLLSILSAQGDRLQTVTTLQAVQADDLKTVLDRQERTADRDAGKFNDLSFILTAVANGIRHIEKELGSAGSSAARHSDLVQRQTATHENLQQMWAAVTQMHAKAAQTAEDNYQALRVQMANMATQLTSIERELGREGESESRHQSIIAYLKALQGKIDALPATDQTPTYRG